MSPGTTTRALQSVLAGEHATIYGYGVAGARLTGADRRRALAAYDSHRRRRDELVALIVARGDQPVAAASSYTLPAAVTSADDAVVLTTLLEERLAAVWADAVGTLSGSLRTLAIGGLRDAAVRAAVWRGGSVPFPGLPERAS
jgi:antitoxin (DNA-binding transcriptional repressor) of toxin-antitoxin stability system